MTENHETLNLKRKMVCPNGCCTTFATTGHVMQEWEVDGLGHFISVLDNCLQVTHGADMDNNWTCTQCGAEAVEGKE